MLVRGGNVGLGGVMLVKGAGILVKGAVILVRGR